MSGKYLLDTNVAIRILNQAVDLEARRAIGFEAFLSLTVVGELSFGAEKSRQPEINRSRIDRLIALCPLVPHDLGTAHRYGKVKAALEQKGRPIPENDLWIAACALQHDLILATLDGHFERSQVCGSKPGSRPSDSYSRSRRSAGRSNRPGEEVAAAARVFHPRVGFPLDMLDDLEAGGAKRLGDLLRGMKAEIQGHGRTEKVLKVDHLVTDMKGDEGEPAGGQGSPRLAKDRGELGGLEVHDRVEGDDA
jgi:tRNA(fMet)-specific endonuclease VapC